MASNISAVWANDGEDKVTQDELRLSNGGNVANSVWDGTTIKCFGAMNEVVQFNLVLEAKTAAAAGVTVVLSNLTGPSGSVIRSVPRTAGNLFNWTTTEAELFYIRYLQIKGLSGFGYTFGSAQFEIQVPAKLRLPLVGGNYTGNWTNRPNHDKFHPEIAVPLELVPTFPIAAGNNQSIWVDIYIPKTAAPGAYTGTVTVKEGGTVTKTVPVTLTVRNFALPDMPSSKTMVWSGYPQVALRYTGEAYPIVGGAHDLLAVQAGVNQRYLMHRHKISIMGDDPWTTNGNASGNERSPGAAYLPFLTGAAFNAANGYAGPGAGVGNNIYSIGTYGQWPWPATQQGFWDATTAWESWFVANAPATERFVYLSDEQGNLAPTEQWANWMKTNPGVGKNLESMATLSFPDATASTPSLNRPTSLFYAGVTSTWQNAANAIANTAGKKLWMYNTPRPGAGAFSTECDGTDLRQKPWGQYKKGIDRWFFWDATNWQLNGSGASIDVFNQAQTWGSSPPVFDATYGMTGGAYSNGDGLLLYPGTDAQFPASSYGISGPIASLRLKYWRRGVQDVDYLTMAAVINPASVTSIVQSMVPQALWELPITNPADPTYYSNVGPSWSDNPDVWEAARAQLAGIIEGGGAPAVPVNTAVPTITGTAQAGQTLTASQGTWTNAPTSYALQWNRAGVPITGAVSSTYVPVAADVGSALTHSSTATNSAGASSPAMSAATATVIAAASPVPVNTSPPGITGAAQVGVTLSSSQGAWTNSPTSYAYQWSWNGTTIAGATAPTYVPVAGDVGHALKVSVIATNAGGASAAAMSAATAAVVAASGGGGVLTVSQLPPAASTKYLRLVVSDAMNPVPWALVQGGGNTFCAVFSDGVGWRVKIPEA